jgi:signal transduction histidine kinase
VATLKAMTAALRDGVAVEPGRRAEALTRMDDAATRMERLVSDLLEVSRLDLHEVPLLCAPVDLREIAEDAVYTHERPARAAGIRLLPVEEGGPVEVEADRLRLSQAVDNLVENAIAYAGEGAEVRVRVRDNPPGLVVEDTGAGIAARHLPFLFDAFYRADAARTPGGTHSGLGLRIARGLVEAHGGTLTIESEEGHGVRAVITLPEPGAVPSAE